MNEIKNKLIELLEKRKELIEERNKLLNKQFVANNIFNGAKSEQILKTNFKDRFGKDNDDIRASFIQKECKSEIKKMKNIENDLVKNKNDLAQIDAEISVYKNIFNGLVETLKIENGVIE